MRRLLLSRRSIALASALLLALVAAGAWASWPRLRSANPAVESTAERSPWISVAAGPRPNFAGRAGGSLSGAQLAAFQLARHEVTNREFAEFAAQTGYRTTAEQQGGGMVFDPQLRAWRREPTANWRRPAGAASSIAGREDFPVVQVSWFDAVAYATWRGDALPSEAEWEQAAVGGQRDALYPWGAAERLRGRYLANYWQGWFPDQDLGQDGFAGLAPVGSFPPTGAGFHDLAGNVWEWSADRFDDAAQRALRGGSWTSAENSLPGYRIAVRRGLAPESAYQDVGFRIVRRVATSGD